MDTRDWTNKAPYLELEEETEQVTIDLYYYEELVKIKELTKKYFSLISNPLGLTSDENQEVINIAKNIKKLL